jgi:Glycosyl hydrolase catalytic core
MRRVLPVAVMLAALVAATPAHAAKREVPRGWLGVVADGPFMEGAYGTQEAEWDQLAASGAESVRIAFRWRAMQPKKSSPPDLGTSDALVLAAAKRGLSLVPVVQATPDWAARYKHKHGASPPRKVSTFTSFLRRLVNRYGSNGTLWQEHPEVAKLPIRDWQIWNEPNFREFWSVRPFAPTFVPMMRAAYKTVHRTDKHARVILAGMANESWAGLKRVYQAGGRGTFDAVALHPYTAKPENVIKLVKLARDVMRGYGDPKRPVWITELSFPAAKGKVDHPFGFETTQSGQVKRLKASLHSLAGQRRKLRIERVFWYAWLTYETRSSSFSWSGLRRVRHGEIVDSSALPAFRSVARRLEGCAKPLGNAAGCA